MISRCRASSDARQQRPAYANCLLCKPWTKYIIVITQSATTIYISSDTVSKLAGRIGPGVRSIAVHPQVQECAITCASQARSRLPPRSTPEPRYSLSPIPVTNSRQLVFTRGFPVVFKPFTAFCSLRPRLIALCSAMLPSRTPEID